MATNPAPQSGFWSPSPWYLAQTVHLLAGPAVLLAAKLHGWNEDWTALVFLLAALIKEYGLDLSPFEGDTFWGSTQDFTAYAYGVAAALATLDHFWIGVALEAIGILAVFLYDFATNANWPKNEWPYD